MNKPIISVRNLSKKYALGERQPYYSFRDTISSVLHTPFHKEKLKKDEFWALKDVSFDINEGDVVGVIGRNGAGKSTLLKILSRITPPTKGEITLRGRVASLLEVGTGFHPELTGRENIYLNGAILGMKRWEINNKFKDIVEFSEIEKFLDTPVKHYSSGMYMRLAFSVAAHLEPEILLVDEVLAVGDVQFQKKCLGKMSEVSKQGRTVLFVSHNMGAINELCKKSILLEKGKLISYGSTPKIVGQYMDNSNKLSSISLRDRVNRNGVGKVKYSKIVFNNSNSVVSGEILNVRISYTSKERGVLKNCRIGLAFNNSMGQALFLCTTEVHLSSGLNLKPEGIVECVINRLPLSEGQYNIDLFLEVDKEVQDWIKDAASIKVEYGKFFKGTRQTPVGYEGVGVLVDHKWKFN